jgi:ATP-dependent Clp protease adapter protein ClpS
VAGTVTISRPKKEMQKDSSTDRGWKVVLFNDDVTSFDVVIFGLQRAAGLSVEVAEMVAHEAHREGQAVVKRGLTEEDAQIICTALRKWTRFEGICPGVHCEPQPDDP